MLYILVWSMNLLIYFIVSIFLHYSIRLALNKPETFKGDIKPQFDEFKKYVKEFYSIILDFENFQNSDNIVLCGLDV